MMDREAPVFTRQSWLGAILVAAQEGYLPLRSFAQLRAARRVFAEPDWCRSQAFLLASLVWSRPDLEQAWITWAETQRQQQLADSQSQ